MTAALVAKQTGLIFAGPVGAGSLYRPRFANPGLAKEDEVALATASAPKPTSMPRGNWCFRILRFVVAYRTRLPGLWASHGDLLQEGQRRPQ